MAMKMGIELSDVEGLVPVDGILAGRATLSIRRARIHVSRATLALTVRRAGTGVRSRLVDLAPEGASSAIVQVRLPQSAVESFIKNLTGWEPAALVTLGLSLVGNGRLRVVVAHAPVLPEKRVAEMARAAMPDIPGVRKGSGVTIADVDIVAMAKSRGLTLPRPTSLVVTAEGITLELGR